LSVFCSVRNNQEIEQWIKNAIQNYYSFVSQYRDLTDKAKPRKPEVYVARIISEIFGPFDNFLIGKIIAKYGFIYQEEQKIKRILEEQAKEEEIKKNAHNRLAGGKNGRRSSMAEIRAKTNMDVNELTSSSSNQDQNEENSILSRSIQEKIDFCYHAMSITIAKLFVKSFSGLLLCQVS
jgi:hypothetical protein